MWCVHTREYGSAIEVPEGRVNNFFYLIGTLFETGVLSVSVTACPRVEARGPKRRPQTSCCSGPCQCLHSSVLMCVKTDMANTAVSVFKITTL